MGDSGSLEEINNQLSEGGTIRNCPNLTRQAEDEKKFERKCENEIGQ